MTESSLAAASRERKARLAQLQTLKRKQDESRTSDLGKGKGGFGEDAVTVTATDITDTPIKDDSGGASQYLSGRNYDALNRAPKLGFEESPLGENADTAERRAERILEEAQTLAAGIIPQSDLATTMTSTSTAAGQDSASTAPTGSNSATVVDLFALRPKKPNWDLRRALDERLEVLKVRTDNAIARVVKERIEQQKVAKRSRGKPAAKITSTAGDDDGVEEGQVEGIEGADLLEALHLREVQAEAERQREEAAEADEEVDS